MNKKLAMVLARGRAAHPSLLASSGARGARRVAEG